MITFGITAFSKRSPSLRRRRWTLLFTAYRRAEQSVIILSGGPPAGRPGARTGDPQVGSFINLIPAAGNSKNLNLKFRRLSLSQLCGKNP
ncbi:hypothetical protein EVAR_20494_1 [Eumeta japonica]|uniref:Uncharacterized protein n=1 Tax=Eumeta variegata TaxID=151549 RepID=A0A4C1Y8Z5_EUMVA|nr:hypothetical protein EVAR_20494_1 [Eumeta japonica]